MLDSS